MNISSETIADMYCEPQFSHVRVMIPAIQSQHGILLIRTGQQSDLEYAANPSGFIPCNMNNNQQAHYSNLHGNANTNVKILNKIATKETDRNDKNDNPIDLSSTSNISSSLTTSDKNVTISDEECTGSNNSSKLEDSEHETIENDIEKRLVAYKIGKRKNTTKNYCNDEDIINDNKRNIDSWVGHVKPVPGIPRQAGSKREEVLKAARSLFSKRTRTLYHWLYPSTSKTKLKSTVAAAWDTLSTAEKDFYISQVLGRFGVPACSLMINPQLGGLKSEEKGGNIGSPPSGTSSNMEETRRAVSNLLLTEDDVAWNSYTQRQQTESDLPRKRRRNQSLKNGENSDRDNCQKSSEEDETLILKQIRDASLEEDFADDPELSTEFEQFRNSVQNVLDTEIARSNFSEVLDGI